MLLHRIGRSRDSLEGCAKMLVSLSYQSVLQRGYALVRDSSGQAVRSVSRVAGGDRLSIEVADGRFDAEAIARAEPAERSAAAEPSAEKRRKAQSPGRGSGGTQGSLF
jgi:exodeoxyribonuclease VII large subunit